MEHWQPKIRKIENRLLGMSNVKCFQQPKIKEK